MNKEFLDQWNKLKKSSSNKNIKDLKQLFNSDKNRVDNFSFQVADIHVDFSKNLLDKHIFDDLLKLANHAKLSENITAMFNGEKINTTENKAATHTQQRQLNQTNDFSNDRNKMYKVANHYQSGQWKTAFGKKVKTLVNIGIGGSYLGPKLAVQALTELQTNNSIKILFFPSVDDTALQQILKSIDIDSTLFCIGSKSLGTIETSKNHQTILDIVCHTENYNPTPTNQSFVAATANFEKAKNLNIPFSHVMPFDNATGGRFSVWSSIGFPVLMAIGKDDFESFLKGAQSIDKHFHETALDKNIPVIMALISIWYRNFLEFSAYAIIPYDVRLINFPAWLQQLMMESNGKMVDKDGKCVDFSTSPWVFGDHGQLSQHAFFQAFHQGKDILPIDFIGVIDKKSQSQDFLLINMLAQSAALMNGNTGTNIQCRCPGNRPSTTFLLSQLDASSLGQLLALYEHMVFVQSVIWNINCFDQPGVELGKKIASNIVDHIENDSLDKMNLDQSTLKLLNRVLK